VGGAELERELREIFPEGFVTFSPDHHPDDLHDESLHRRTVEPFAVVRPASTADVVTIVDFARAHALAITPRGSGTGLSGAATPAPGGIVVSFERMNRVLDVDVNDHVAVAQPGVTLRELGVALEGTGLRYPVYPGELSGSLGGNVNTNAGGMRAVRHGVTRHHVLGLELVLANGSVVRTGGRVVKSSSGYDVTQLILGSEGTLALVTEVTLKLSPALDYSATVLVPFASLEDVTRVVPTLVSSGLQPSMLEYLDALTLSAITQAASVEVGVEKSVSERALAYLLVVLETRTAEQLDSDTADLALALDAAGALDVYVLTGASAQRLIEARERLFWVTKESGARDIVDVVVPRSAVPTFLAEVAAIAARHSAFIPGCGHVGDGNVHLSVYLDDDVEREIVLHELFRAGLALGGQISGEHGIGRDKQSHYLALTDPHVLDLERQLKAVFDPQGLFNPFRSFDATVGASPIEG